MRATRQPLQDLDDLLLLAQEVISAEDHTKLLDLIVKRALCLLHGDRGFLVLCQGEDLRLEVIRNWSAEEYEGGKDPISRSILQKVLARTEPLHIEDASTHPDFAKKESVQALEIRSVLAAPIIVEEQRLGVLYLESRAPRRFFREAEHALFSRLLQLTARALRASTQRLLLSQRVALLERNYLTRYQMPGVVTQDERFAKLLELLGQAAGTGLPVLLQGDRGTGKELLTRIVHLNSARSQKPFVCVSCAVISSDAIEGELFGYTKGYKGAPSAKEGALSLAHQGTLFLDEVAELSTDLQAKLSLALRRGEVTQLGATRARPMDLRIVASTRRDLAQEVEEERFRDDLFYQLNGATFQLPRLRERADDILPLFAHFLTSCAEREARLTPPMTPALEKVLEGYHWPGNVRELESEARRLFALTSPGEWLNVERLSTRITTSPITSNRLLRLEEQERETILTHLKASEGNRSQAAETLGISREGLRKMLKRCGLDGYRFEGE